MPIHALGQDVGMLSRQADPAGPRRSSGRAGQVAGAHPRDRQPRTNASRRGFRFGLRSDTPPVFACASYRRCSLGKAVVEMASIETPELDMQTERLGVDARDARKGRAPGVRLANRSALALGGEAVVASQSRWRVVLRTGAPSRVCVAPPLARLSGSARLRRAGISALDARRPAG
jgi:hypothetical protein